MLTGGWPRVSGWGSVLPLTFSSPYRYAVMQRCWAADPAARPTFGVLVGEVEQVVAALRGDHYVNLGLGALEEANVPPEQLPPTPMHRSTGRPRPLSEPPRPT